MWDRLEDAGVEIELFERGSDSGKEQGVDQGLQAHMLRALVDSSDLEIAVLLTGDGAGYDDGSGFHADLERMRKRGWGVEVLSWDMACKRQLKTWAASAGVYVPLDDYYNSITFIQGGRASTPLSLRNRATAQPT